SQRCASSTVRSSTGSPSCRSRSAASGAPSTTGCAAPPHPGPTIEAADVKPERSALRLSVSLIVMAGLGRLGPAVHEKNPWIPGVKPGNDECEGDPVCLDAALALGEVCGAAEEGGQRVGHDIGRDRRE